MQQLADANGTTHTFVNVILLPMMFSIGVSLVLLGLVLLIGSRMTNEEGNMNKKLKMWFTDERRQAIQMFGVVLATMLVTTGAITQDQTQHVYTLVALAIQLFAGIVSLMNLTVHEAASQFLTVGRGAVYAAAPLVAAAGVGLGLIREETVPNMITWIGIVLTAVSALVAIVFNKDPAAIK